jgi:hypothetical protein
MKKNRNLLVVLLLLVAVTIYFIIDTRFGSMNEELRDFSYKDTASLSKIFLADKSGKQITLERKSKDEWIVNGKYWARPDAIQTLLQTIHDVEVWSPVGKKSFNTTIKNIAAKGIKVELYAKGNKVKTYYVGGATQDQLGTYMYMENSSVPFITSIAGFNGYLTPRYITERTDWLVKNVFRLREGELVSLSVADRERFGHAFRIEKPAGSNDYLLYDGFDRPVANVVQDMIIDYLQRYRVINFEGLEKGLLPSQRDSIRSTTPFRTIVMVKTGGDTSRIDLWRRPVTSQTSNLNMERKTFTYDIDRMTGSINKDTSLILVQYFSFDKLFLEPADFQTKSKPR